MSLCGCVFGSRGCFFFHQLSNENFPKVAPKTKLTFQDCLMDDKVNAKVERKKCWIIFAARWVARSEWELNRLVRFITCAILWKYSSRKKAFDNFRSVLWVIDQSLKAHWDVAPNSLLPSYRFHICWTLHNVKSFTFRDPLEKHSEALNAMMIIYTSMDVFPSIIWLPGDVWREEGEEYFRIKSPKL